MREGNGIGDRLEAAKTALVRKMVERRGVKRILAVVDRWMDGMVWVWMK